jgi:hypothetical protein
VLLSVIYKVHNSSALARTKQKVLVSPLGWCTSCFASALARTKQKVLVSPLAGARLVLRVQSYEKKLKQAQNGSFL